MCAEVQSVINKNDFNGKSRQEIESFIKDNLSYFEMKGSFVRRRQTHCLSNKPKYKELNLKQSQDNCG